MVGQIEWAAEETIRKLNETLEFNVEYVEDDLYVIHFTDSVGPASFIVEGRYSPTSYTCGILAAHEMDTQRLIWFMEIFVKLLNS